MASSTNVPCLDPNSNPVAWRRWRKFFEAHAVLTKLEKKSEEERVATIVMTIGPPAMRIYETLPFTTEAEKADTKATLDYLEEHFVGATNVIFGRWHAVQRPLISPRQLANAR